MYDPFSDLVSQLAGGGGDQALRDSVRNFVIEDSVWKMNLLGFLKHKGLVDLDELNTYMKKHTPSNRAIVDQEFKEAQDAALKKWVEENPDKARMLKLFGGLGGQAL